MALVGTPGVPPHLLGSSRYSTPDDYLVPSFPLPARSDPTPRIVGLLACQCDPLLEELETKVVACRKVERQAVAAGKGKAGKKGGAVEQKDEWEIELVDTVLFPEGGGQPSDVGTITALDGPSTTVDVTSAFRRGLTAVHIASGPLPIGSKVLVKLDVELRRDHMTQHTAQHLLSAVLESEPYGVETLSWSLTRAPEACYVELPREPSASELRSVEDRCNALIRTGNPVRVELAQMASDEGLEKRDDYVGGVKRTVVIDGVDKNPCCGTHVPSLAFIQAIHVLPTTSTIRGSNTRVYFLAGPRVVDGLRSAMERVRLIGGELAVGPDMVVERVKGTLGQAKEGRAREKRLREETAGFLAERLAAQLASAKQEGGLKTALLVRDEDATNDIDFLNLVAFKVKEVVPPPASPWLVLLACASSISPQSGGAILVTASEDAAGSVDQVGKAIREKLGAKVKGGGKGRWQGKLSTGETWTASDKSQLEQILQSVA